MILKLNDKYLKKFISEHEYECIAPMVTVADKMLREKSGLGNSFLGWMDLPENYDKKEFERIKIAAKRIQADCDAFIVIGIGGSYLGTRAIVDFLNSVERQGNGKYPEIYYAGCNISAASLNDLLYICENKNVCINVISKSGTTTEPAVAFRILRAFLEKKYGVEEANKRIYVTTDKARGTLKSFATQQGYETFVIPDDVGGRFSVLTAVGLLPVAVAGIDIDALMQGANDARIAYSSADLNKNDAYKYAAMRNILYRKGKSVELLVGYEPFVGTLQEWWKQLFGESEGKDGKGIFPASVIFSTDLHSLGQYIQEGERILFETVLSVNDTKSMYTIPYDEANIDGLNFLAGRDINELKQIAMRATQLAHIDGGVPNIHIELEERSAYCLGYLIYFFELACAMSGYLLGVNPFDQPGVEAYKKNMFAMLSKPGYEELRKALEERNI
ncbi:MAG: glucose-6-phosphate isomerase [Clostridia bacterium]|nr:glucose-6-phosphate isomerase [Clostridia bacterium]